MSAKSDYIVLIDASQAYICNQCEGLETESVTMERPVLQSVEVPTEAIVTLTPTKFTFDLESEPENVQDLRLIIQTSAPQSNGVTRAYSKAVQIGGVLEAVTEEYDIKEEYDNKHGAPNAAAPKIFMKYFFVNTKTDEKSGEMLTMVRLDEDAPADGE